MSAVAAYWPRSFRLEALAAFPADPSLADRGLRDGVGGLYRQMHKRGELLVLGRHLVPVSGLLTEALERWGRPVAIVVAGARPTWRWPRPRRAASWSGIKRLARGRARRRWRS